MAWNKITKPNTSWSDIAKPADTWWDWINKVLLEDLWFLLLEDWWKILLENSVKLRPDATVWTKIIKPM